MAPESERRGEREGEKLAWREKKVFAASPREIGGVSFSFAVVLETQKPLNSQLASRRKRATEEKKDERRGRTGKVLIGTNRDGKRPILSSIQSQF